MSNGCCQRKNSRHFRSSQAIGAYAYGQRSWTCGCVFLRKNGWQDLDAVQARVTSLRTEQSGHEPRFLSEAEERRDPGPAWELISNYHLAKAAEILGMYLSQGSVDGHYDIREQLEAQFDRAIAAAARGQLMECEAFARLLARTARTLVDNSIWTVTRAVNSRVTEFVKSMTARERQRPIFEMLPPPAAYSPRGGAARVRSSLGCCESTHLKRQDFDCPVPDVTGIEPIRPGAWMGCLPCSDAGTRQPTDPSPAT